MLALAKQPAAPFHGKGEPGLCFFKEHIDQDQADDHGVQRIGKSKVGLVFLSYYDINFPDGYDHVGDGLGDGDMLALQSGLKIIIDQIRQLKDQLQGDKQGDQLIIGFKIAGGPHQKEHTEHGQDAGGQTHDHGCSHDDVSFLGVGGQLLDDYILQSQRRQGEENVDKGAAIADGAQGVSGQIIGGGDLNEEGNGRLNQPFGDDPGRIIDNAVAHAFFLHIYPVSFFSFFVIAICIMAIDHLTP